MYATGNTIDDSLDDLPAAVARLQADRDWLRSELPAPTET